MATWDSGIDGTTAERPAAAAAGARRTGCGRKLISIGDDYWIEDEHGERAFKVNGKALRIRETLFIDDPSGQQLMKIQERKLSIRDTMTIEGASGETLATVKKAMISPLRERFKVDVTGGEGLEVLGNIVDHEYEISRGGDKIAEVSKKWFRIADRYGVEVVPGENPALMLAITWSWTRCPTTSADPDATSDQLLRHAAVGGSGSHPDLTAGRTPRRLPVANGRRMGRCG